MNLTLHDIMLNLTPSEIVKGLTKSERIQLFAELFENLSIPDINDLLKAYSWKIVEEIE